MPARHEHLYQQWRDDLYKQCTRGKIWRTNFDWEVSKGHISSATAARMRDEIVSWIHEHADRDSPFDVVSGVLKRRAVTLQGTRRPAELPALSRIVDHRVFVRQYVDTGGFGLDAGETSDDLVLDKLWPLPQEHLRGELHNEVGIGWYTSTEDLAGLRDTPDRLRNRLGLADMKAGVRLIQLNIPPDAFVQAGVFAAPTSLDTDSTTFSPTPDSDGWGRTVDVQGYTDGVRELVMSPIPIPTPLQAEDLGILATNIELDLEALLKRSESLG